MGSFWRSGYRPRSAATIRAGVPIKPMPSKSPPRSMGLKPSSVRRRQNPVKSRLPCHLTSPPYSSTAANDGAIPLSRCSTQPNLCTKRTKPLPIHEPTAGIYRRARRRTSPTSSRRSYCPIKGSLGWWPGLTHIARPGCSMTVKCPRTTRSSRHQPERTSAPCRRSSSTCTMRSAASTLRSSTASLSFPKPSLRCKVAVTSSLRQAKHQPSKAGRCCSPLTVRVTRRKKVRMSMH